MDKFKKNAVITLILLLIVLTSFVVWNHFNNQQLIIDPKLSENVSVIQTPVSFSVEKSAFPANKSKKTFIDQSTIDSNSFFRNFTPIDSDVDVAKVQQLSTALVSGTEDEQIDAIKLFSKIGTEDQKTVIEGYAKDTTNSIAIRLAAIEYIDFDKNADFLSNIIQGDDGIAEATLNMASDMEFSQETQEKLNESAFSAFQNTSRPSTQIAILNYYFEQHSARFDELAVKISFDGYSQEEKEDVLRLINERGKEINPATNTP